MPITRAETKKPVARRFQKMQDVLPLIFSLLYEAH